MTLPTLRSIYASVNRNPADGITRDEAKKTVEDAKVGGGLLGGIYRTGAEQVVLLPNDKDTVMAAQSATEKARERGIRVRVVRARTVVQGLAALVWMKSWGPDADAGVRRPPSSTVPTHRNWSRCVACPTMTTGSPTPGRCPSLNSATGRSAGGASMVTACWISSDGSRSAGSPGNDISTSSRVLPHVLCHGYSSVLAATYSSSTAPAARPAACQRRP